MIDLLTCNKFQKLIVGFSGGVDSIVLLHLLNSHNFNNIHAVHINHNINKDSLRWENFCASFAREIKVPFSSVNIHPKKNIESVSRNLRHEIFKDYVGPDDALVLAHHLDDQFETLLFRIFRGTGIHGLQGIQKQNKIKDMSLIRPLLSCSKQDILDYARKHNLRWCEDPSNKDTSYSRNYIRNNIVPVIKKQWPNVLNNMSSVIDDAKSCMEITSKVIYDFDYHNFCLTALKLKDEPIRFSIFRNYLKKYDIQATRKQIEQVDSIFIKNDGKTFEINHYCLYSYQNRLNIKKITPKHTKSEIQFKKFLFINDTLITPYGLITKTIGDNGLHLNKNDKLEIGFRTHKTMYLTIGEQKKKTLKKLMSEKKIPDNLRDEVPLIYINDELIGIIGWFIPKHLIKEKGYLFNIKQTNLPSWKNK